MKKRLLIIPLLLLGVVLIGYIVVKAQSSFAPARIIGVGQRKVMTTTAGYPVDLYLDFESGSNGDSITATNAHPRGSACTYGAGLFTYADSGAAGFQTISTVYPTIIPKNVSVGGYVGNGAPNTRSYNYTPGADACSGQCKSAYTQCQWNPGLPNVSFGEYYTTTNADSVHGYSIVSGFISGGGDYVVTHQVPCSGGAGIHINSSDSGCFPTVPGHTYYISGLYQETGTYPDGVGGKHWLLIFDPSQSYLLVGKVSLPVGTNGGSNALAFVLGRDGADSYAGA